MITELPRIIKNKINLHIILIIIGTMYLASGAFHASIWFDESYTVGLINYNLLDLCKIAIYDVHPHLYYILLKLFSYIFGNSIISLRLFSVLGAVVLASLGFTHIRKDFGEKTGFWFTFFAIFFSSSFKYALQIRMYTWAPVFVTLAAIYAYRMINYIEKPKKNSILFMTFSIMAAYTHYYGLIAVAIINLIVLTFYIIKKVNLTKWILMACIQLGVFLPGLSVFLLQSRAGGASWIKVIYPNVIIDTITFNFVGVPLSDISVNSPIYKISLCLAVTFYVLMIYCFLKFRKNKTEKVFPVVLAFIVYFGVIVFFLGVSVFRPIYYVRYSIVSNGLLIFACAYLFARFNKTKIKFILAILLVAMSVLRAVPIYQENYDSSNSQIDQFLEDNLQPGDIIVFDDFSAFSIAVKYQKVQTYYYNVWGWDIEDAYKAFGKNVVITRNLDELKDYKGRIWLLGSGAAYDKVMNYSGSKEISRVYIQYTYYNNSKDMILIDKN